jgi:hypothetical protein
MSKGRKPIAITKEELVELVAKVESAGPFTSRNALWQAVADTEKAKAVGLSSQVAMLKAKKWEITPITPVGTRGKIKGQTMPVTGQRRSKRISLTVVEVLKKAFPKHRHGTIRRAARGSLTAATKLKCLDCCNQDVDSIRECTITSCPLWSFRPYKSKAKPKQEVVHTGGVTIADLGLGV